MFQAELHQPIYLDNNATTPLLPEVTDAMCEAYRQFPANPASQHRAGQAARRALEDARERIAELLGARLSGHEPDRLIFTSGGTEANNLAILGLLAAQEPAHLITSAIEHPSIQGPVAQLELRGWRVSRVEADERGTVRPDKIKSSFRDNTRLVSVMAANNETGALQPMEEIGGLCASHGVPLHTDATQWVGKLPISFHGHWKLAAMSFTAHKFNGPLGIGALLVRHSTAIAPQLHGGHQQAGERPGTESVALAVGMQTALESWRRDAAEHVRHIAAMRDAFESVIAAEIPDAVILGGQSPRLPNTTCVAFPGIDRQAFFLALDMAGIACSTGSACASGSSEPSPVLVAMGLSNMLVESALRFSFGKLNTTDEACAGARRIVNVYQYLQR